MKHEYKVLKCNVGQGKPSMGEVFVNIVISVTFISKEKIRNLYLKLYINFCAFDLHLRALTIVNYRNYWLHPTNLVQQWHLYYCKIAKATFVSYQTSDKWVGKWATKWHKKNPWKASLNSTYVFKNLKVKVSRNERYLNTAKDVPFQFTETLPFT